MQEKLPLAGLRVLDLSRALAGPFCAMILADLGADVIKIEPTPDGEMVRGWGPFKDGISVYYLSIHRNKRSLAVNFRDPDGLKLIRTLADKSDILVENFKPGVMADMKMDYAAIAAHPGAAANTLQQFLQLGPKNDSKLRVYANGGVGSPGHFAAAYLESLAAVEFTHVPYRGAGPAIADVIGGQVPYILSTLTGLLPHIKAGKLKAIALTSPERSSLLPNVPTIAESGFPGYDMDSWMGTFVPRATPAAVMKVLHEATLEALKQPAVRERVEAQAGRLTPGSGEALDAIVADDIKRYSKIVRERGIKAE
jgi:tripartite-type tricarboxylate transporter receptor subunit TctC